MLPLFQKQFCQSFEAIKDLETEAIKNFYFPAQTYQLQKKKKKSLLLPIYLFEKDAVYDISLQSISEP